MCAGKSLESGSGSGNPANKAPSPAVNVAVSVVVEGLGRYSASRWSEWYSFSGRRLAEVSPVVSQSGDDVRLEKPPESLEKILENGRGS